MTVVKDVEGIVYNTPAEVYHPALITVRFTQDKLGKSLSLAFKNVMIEIPAEQIEDIIKIELR